MKKVFLFLLMAVAGLAATQAQQEYHSVPFDLDNGFWYEFSVDEDAYMTKSWFDYFHFKQFYIDTNEILVNGVKYREIICENNGDISGRTGMGIREDTSARRVYLMVYNVERLLYDFSVKQGDTIKKNIYLNYGGSTYDYVVSSVDTIVIGGVQRKKINFLPTNGGQDNTIWNYTHGFTLNEYWIEGIGSSMGLLFPAYIYDTSDVMYNVLVCYSANGSVIYHNSHFTDCMPTNTITSPESTPSITAYPNPAKERVTLEFGEARFNTLRLVNTAGATVLETTLTGQEPQHTLQLKGLPAGIYSCILSGKDGTATEKIVVE